MADRRALSKKLRFEVFKRDGFVCQYCGRHPPEVTLAIDHIQALAAGGVDDETNLVTSCADCNLGKGARDLTVAPMGLGERASIVEEREAQLRGYYDIMEAQRQRIEDQVWTIVHVFEPEAERYSRDNLQSIKRFIEELGFHEVLEAAEIAMAASFVHYSKIFSYFCGICWNKIRARKGGDNK